VQPLLGYLALHVVGSPQEAGVRGNGHDAGKNGDGDSAFADLSDPADEIVGVVEHLGDDEGGTLVNLVLQMIEKLLLILVVVAAFRVAGHANVEVIAVSLPDMPHEVASVLVSILGGGPLL